MVLGEAKHTMSFTPDSISKTECVFMKYLHVILNNLAETANYGWYSP
jgi:hypothetical protein